MACVKVVFAPAERVLRNSLFAVCSLTVSRPSMITANEAMITLRSVPDNRYEEVANWSVQQLAIFLCRERFALNLQRASCMRYDAPVVMFTNHSSM